MSSKALLRKSLWDRAAAGGADCPAGDTERCVELGGDGKITELVDGLGSERVALDVDCERPDLLAIALLVRLERKFRCRNGPRLFSVPGLSISVL